MENRIKEIHLSDIKLDTSSSFRGTTTIDGKRYIVKKAHAIAEYFTSHLMGLMGIPVQNTSFAMLDDGLVVLCEDFTPTDMRFVPGFRLFEELFPAENIEDIYDLTHLKEVFKEYLGERAEEALLLFIYKSIFDCIVKQQDFGSGNWGILQGKQSRLAPFYDNALTMVQLMKAIETHSYSLEESVSYALGKFGTPFIHSGKGNFIAVKGFEDVTEEAANRFKKTYPTESFCSFVKDALSSLSRYTNNIGKKEGMFLYTSLVLRYLHIIEGLAKDELLEVANGIPSY